MPSGFFTCGAGDGLTAKELLGANDTTVLAAGQA